MSSGIKDLIYGLISNLAKGQHVPGGRVGIAEAANSSSLTQEELASLLGSALYFLDGKVEECRNTQQLLDHIFARVDKALKELREGNENQDWRDVRSVIEQLAEISKIKDQLRNG